MAATAASVSSEICAHDLVSEDSQHDFQRHQYCRWLKGDLQREIPVYVKPDSLMTLRELGKKYKSIFGKTKCVLIDLSGTLHIGDRVTDNAVEALG
jgi:hypothetical protein